MYSSPSTQFVESPQFSDNSLQIPNDHTVTVIIGLILLLILFLLAFNLYIDNNVVNGVTLSFEDTIRNIFRLKREISIKAKISAGDIKIKSQTNIKLKPKCKPKRKEKKCNRPSKPSSIPNLDNDVGVDKEVFNIDVNDFTYDQAHLMCKALDSNLATYKQLLNAHKKGANWCNYGWSANGLALYPIQQKYWNKLQGTGRGTQCGKPGINGGFFANKKIKFGVNCYGIKPQPDKSKIIHRDKCGGEDLIQQYKEKIQNGKIDLRPFNKTKWSKYSKRDSQYILTPNSEEDLIMEKKIYS